MTTLAQSLRRAIRRGAPPVPAAPAPAADAHRLPQRAEVAPVDIAPNDPIIAFFHTATGAVDLDELKLASPARDALRAAGVKLVVPLVSQGELIGLLNLGPRLSEQEYSGEDRRLLERLAAQAAPAVRVAQLVREQEAEARERERIEHELQVARLIQQNFLPREVPNVSGWHLAALYRPAREVGGDFYDFIDLPDGLLGLVIGDVTDKGMPAALVMAATRAVMRASAQRLVWPGAVLECVNDLMCPDMPPNMFVTCLYAVLDAAAGRLRFANAGHDMPYARTAGGLTELRARGMPLGLMPGMQYEEKEASLAPGDHVLFYSDGLVEAHDPARQMFGFPRLKTLVRGHAGGDTLIDVLLGELDRFTGDGWEQEDDVTLVTLQRAAGAPPVPSREGRSGGGQRAGGRAGAEGSPRPGPESSPLQGGDGTLGDGSRILADFSLPSEPGNERLAMERVAEAVQGLGLPERRLKRLKTAVAEATMNAIEHGNQNRPELPVDVRVLASDTDLSVQITDQGGDRPFPQVERPDLEAKLAGLQRARGWGLFLIKNMVDELDVTSDAAHHTIALTLHLRGDADGDHPL